MPPSAAWYKGCGFNYQWYCVTGTEINTHICNFLGKIWQFIIQKHVHAQLYTSQYFHRFPFGFNLRFRFGTTCDNDWAVLYILSHIPFWKLPMNLGYSYQQRIINRKDSFRYFRLLMSNWRDSICENTFETSHVRFIHENFSVLITTPPDQIEQNLLRKETCQTTAKPADIVLQTWFEEYPTPP